MSKFWNQKRPKILSFHFILRAADFFTTEKYNIEASALILV